MTPIYDKDNVTIEGLVEAIDNAREHILRLQAIVRNLSVDEIRHRLQAINNDLYYTLNPGDK